MRHINIISISIISCLISGVIINASFATNDNDNPCNDPSIICSDACKNDKNHDYDYGYCARMSSTEGCWCFLSNGLYEQYDGDGDVNAQCTDAVDECNDSCEYGGDCGYAQNPGEDSQITSCSCQTDY